MEKRPSKADQLRALREAMAAKDRGGSRSGKAKNVLAVSGGKTKRPSSALRADGAQPPRDDTEEYRRWCKIIADIPSPAKLENGEAVTQRTVNAPIAGSNPASPAKRPKAPNGTFDKRAYQRELMRKRRAAAKEKAAT